MSPGHFTLKHSKRLENSLKKKRLKQTSRSAKRRRLELKKERSSKDEFHSVTEGESYLSKIGLEESVDIQDIIFPQDDFNLQNNSLVFFDLETTGLARNADILQIACACGDRTFSTYIRPTCSISFGASAASGITFSGGILRNKGQPVAASSILDGLDQFLSFLASLSHPILIGHNIQNFDIPILLHHLNKHNLLKNFQDLVSGFIDTLKLSKKVFSKADVENYKQENLVEKLLGKTYEAHNAMADVKALQMLFIEKLQMKCANDDIFTLSYFDCKASLEPLLKAKVISSITLKKLIGLSLNLLKLQVIHKRDPNNGIQNVFSDLQPNTKKPKVSKSQAVINRVVQYLSDL